MKKTYKNPQTTQMVLSPDCHVLVGASTNGVGFGTGGGSGQVG